MATKMKNGLRRIQFYLPEESYLKILPEIQNSGLTESAFCSEKIVGAKLSSRGAPAGNQNKKGKYKIAGTLTRINLLRGVKEFTFGEAKTEAEEVLKIDNESYIDLLHRTDNYDSPSEETVHEMENQNDGSLLTDASGVSQPMNLEELRLISVDEVDALIDNIDEIFCQIKHPPAEEIFKSGQITDPKVFDSNGSVGDQNTLSEDVNDIPANKHQPALEEHNLPIRIMPLKQTSLFDM